MVAPHSLREFQLRFVGAFDSAATTAVAVAGLRAAVSQKDDGSGSACSGDDSNFCELTGAVGLARRGASFVDVGLMIGRIVGRDEICHGDDSLLGQDFVRFFFGDDVGFCTGGDLEVAGDGGDVDLARRVHSDLAGRGRIALWNDSNVGRYNSDGVTVVATEGERAGAEFSEGTFCGVRGVEAAVAVGGETVPRVANANVGRAADVGADFFAGKDAGAFGERTLADVREIRL
jgi:hypothetical protein